MPDRHAEDPRKNAGSDGSPPDDVPRYRLESACFGALLGLACGDALGAAVECLDHETIARLFPSGLRRYQLCAPGSLLQGLHPGTYTDDTVMSLGLAEALIAREGELDLDVVAEAWMAWKTTGPYHELGPGVACDQAIARLLAGIPPHQSGIEGSAGNGGAMRVAPIGLLHWDDPEQCRAQAVAQSRITHRHPEADAAAACMAQAIAFLVRHHRQPFHERDLWDLLKVEAHKHSQVFMDALHSVEGNHKIPRNVSGYVTKTLPAALRIFLEHRHDFAEAVRLAASAGGDTDTLAAMVGGLGGAYLGPAAIPVEWREGLRERPRVEAAARGLAILLSRGAGPETQRRVGSRNIEHFLAQLAELERSQPDLPLDLAHDLAQRPSLQALALAQAARDALACGQWAEGMKRLVRLGEFAIANKHEAWLGYVFETLRRHGQAARYLGKHTEAAAFIGTAYERFAKAPIRAAEWIAFCEVLSSAGQWPKGILVLKRLMDSEEVREGEYADWLQCTIHLTMGNLLDDADDLEGALGAYRACIACGYRDPSDPDVENIAAALTNIGMAFKRREEWQLALQHFEQAQEIEPSPDLQQQIAQMIGKLTPMTPLLLQGEAPVAPGFRVLSTLDRPTRFHCRGSIQEGVKIRTDRFRGRFEKDEWKAMLLHFSEASRVMVGTSHTNPPAGSLGAYLMGLKKPNMASYLAAILVEERWAVVEKIGRAMHLVPTEKWKASATSL